MALTSDEMNYLVYRYLLENGFTHAAFALGHESRVDGAKVAEGDEKIPPGALIAFTQKGLQYCEIEANLNDVRVCRCFKILRVGFRDESSATMRRAGARSQISTRIALECILRMHFEN